MKNYEFDGYFVKVKENDITIIDRKRTAMYTKKGIKLDKFNMSSLDAALNSISKAIKASIEETESTALLTLQFKDSLVGEFSQQIQLNDKVKLTQHDHIVMTVQKLNRIIKRYDDIKKYYEDVTMKLSHLSTLGRQYDPKSYEWENCQDYDDYNNFMKDACSVQLERGNYLITISLFTTAYAQELKFQFDSRTIVTYLPVDPQGYPLQFLMPITFRLEFEAREKKQFKLQISSPAYQPVYIENCILTAEKIKQ